MFCWKQEVYTSSEINLKSHNLFLVCLSDSAINVHSDIFLYLVNIGSNLPYFLDILKYDFQSEKTICCAVSRQECETKYFFVM